MSRGPLRTAQGCQGDNALTNQHTEIHVWLDPTDKLKTLREDRTDHLGFI